MKTLFGDIEEIPFEKTLKIKKEKKLLSRNQKNFNQLTGRIRTLEKEIPERRTKLFRLHEEYNKKIQPLDNENALLRLEIASSLSENATKNKFSKNKMEDIGIVICDLCDMAFQYIEPDEKQKKLYDQWSEMSYDDDIKEQTDSYKDLLADLLNDELGMDIDPDDIGESDEDFARLQQQIRDQFEREMGKAQKSNSENRKKTKKQIANEEMEKAKAELRNKTIRSIYIALVKILHPDSETDPVKKLEKEEEMKKVTAAYESNDLSVLLKLEMQWLHRENDQLEALPDEKLGIFNEVLREQVNRLEAEMRSIYNNPAFAGVAKFSHLRDNVAMFRIQEKIKEIKKIRDSLKDISEFLRISKNKKEMNYFINDYLKKMEERDRYSSFSLFNNFFR